MIVIGTLLINSLYYWHISNVKIPAKFASQTSSSACQSKIAWSAPNTKKEFLMSMEGQEAHSNLFNTAN